MGKAKPSAEKAEQIARFKALIAYLEAGPQKTNATQIAALIERSPSTLSAARTRGPSIELQQLLRAKVGVDERYWESPTRLDPAACIVPVGPRTSAAEMRAAIARQKIIAIARARREPDAIVAALARLDPPRGGEDDAWWWVDQYFTIADAAHRTRKAAG